MSHPRLCNGTIAAYSGRIQFFNCIKEVRHLPWKPTSLNRCTKQKNASLDHSARSINLVPNDHHRNVTSHLPHQRGRLGTPSYLAKKPSLRSVTHFARFWWLSRFVTLERQSGNVGPVLRETVSRRLRYNVKSVESRHLECMTWFMFSLVKECLGRGIEEHHSTLRTLQANTHDGRMRPETCLET